MSRSNPTPTNPAKHFFQWSGSKGSLSWYDKEKQQEIIIPLPFQFLVLDELATITGFSEQDSSRYWSNEVRSVAREEFTVRTTKGTKAVGLYKDLADVRGKGAKYAKSIYIAYRDEAGDFVIGNLRASGAALTAWIELTSKNNVANGKVILSGSTEGQKGTTIYQIPVFEYDHSDTAEDEIAIALDRELQIYLKQSLAPVELSQGDDVPTSDIVEPDDMVGNDPHEFDHLPVNKKVIHSMDTPAEVPPEKQGTHKAVRNWERVGKKQQEIDAEPLPEEPEGGMPFEGQEIPIDETPFN